MKIHPMTKKEPDGGQKYCFHCPACGFAHWFVIGGKYSWTWNNDPNNPTISPSILAYADDFRCHSFVKNGKIKYCNDCTHSMKGQTIDLPDFINPNC